jgi:hypothetical protein
VAETLQIKIIKLEKPRRHPDYYGGKRRRPDPQLFSIHVYDRDGQKLMCPSTWDPRGEAAQQLWDQGFRGRLRFIDEGSGFIPICECDIEDLLGTCHRTGDLPHLSDGTSIP